MSATAALRGGEALLVPPALHQWPQLQPRFARTGITLADVPLVEIDALSGELVVPEPALPHDASVLAALDGVSLRGNECAPVLPGRYAVRAWLFGRPPGVTGVLSPAVSTVTALPYVVGDRAVRDDVELLGSLFGRVRGEGISYGNEAELVEAVVAAFG